ncbi:hypothetical protein FFF34_013515 [Inquilinus sp. KBS0705]|nr:hypothetical protein FFF34_013515 [Inquilinus sp. KBS0705]
MKAIKNILLLTVTMLCAISNSYAQQLQQLQSSFNKYEQGALQEKVFVHTDKSAYLSGEIIWFKAYCVDGTYHKPLNISKVLYVDVIDNTQNAILQAKISLTAGSGNGSFLIPVSVANGNYKLRAYTNWMKNFGPDYFFEKKITIVNTLRPPEQVKTTAAAFNVQFFPEGGTLLAGVTNNVAFKAVASNGKGITFKGAIVNPQNDTVARFQPLKFGMGHFSFTPVGNTIYRAVITTVGNKPFIKDMPAVSATGYAMQLTDAGGGNLRVRVNGTSSGRIYLFAHTGHLTKVAQSADLDNGTASFVISKAALDEGVSHITIFNENKQPVCERLYFKRPKQALFINANTDMAQYATRKKVNVQVAAKDASGKLLPAGLSMAVFRADSLQDVNQEDIASYFWLSADLKGTIESAAYYLNTITAEADEAADNLMLTQGWSRFKWDNVLKDKTPAFTYLPEYNGHIVNAKIIDQATNLPASNVVAFMAIPGKRVQLYAAKSDSAGRLLFNTKQMFGPGEIVVQTNTELDSTSKLEVLSPFYEQYSKNTLPIFSLTPGMQKTLQEASIGMQVQNVYAGNKLKQFYNPGVDSSAFYSKPYKTYKLDDYTRFITMEEVLREYIREVNVFHPSGKYHIKVIDEKSFLSGDPLVLLDGIPVFNINKVMAIDPLKVRRLEVIRNRYYWGPSVYEGVLSYTTYKGDLGGTEMDPHAVIVDYEGMQLQREFYSPVYETDAQVKSRMPDFRSLLYWSPDIDTGTQAPKSVSFYTSDQAGKYWGVVQGMTPGGQAGSQIFSFEVK